jgi:LPXTG-site transpeptidase (sortase) family protein
MKLNKAIPAIQRATAKAIALLRSRIQSLNWRRDMRVTSLLLIASGLMIMLPISYFSFKNKVVSAQDTPVITSPDRLDSNAITGHPKSISIPSLNINLAVIDGNYDKQTGEWTLTLDKAQFATMTVPPNNEKGNTLIYGHYRPEVFAYLHLIKPGAQAVITTTNGYLFTYTYTNSQAFDPGDTSIFLYKGKPRLTIQTCSGSFMQHRQMYYFQLAGYKKIRS